MTEIERKALELVNEVAEVQTCWFSRDVSPLHETLCRAIEQHEAFRQEVSDAAEHLCTFYGVPIVMDKLARFIIPKPDPLVEAMNEWQSDPVRDDDYTRLREALAKRGLEIRERSE